MHKNVENVLERDRKLGDLEERADALQDGCAQFEKQAAAMKNKFFMDDQPQGGYPPQGYYPPPQGAPAADAGAGGEAAPADDGGAADAGGDDGGASE